MADATSAPDRSAATRARCSPPTARRSRSSLRRALRAPEAPGAAADRAAPPLHPRHLRAADRRHAVPLGREPDRRRTRCRGTVAALEDWDAERETVPDEPVFAALHDDLVVAVEAQDPHPPRLAAQLRELRHLLALPLAAARRRRARQTRSRRSIRRWEEAGFWDELMSAGRAPTTRRRPARPGTRPARGADHLRHGRRASASCRPPRAGRGCCRSPPATYADLRDLRGQGRRRRARRGGALGGWSTPPSAYDLRSRRCRRPSPAYAGPRRRRPGSAAVAEVATRPGRRYPRDLPRDPTRTGAEPATGRRSSMFSGPYTDGYFLNAVDLQKTPDGAGAEARARAHLRHALRRAPSCSRDHHRRLPPARLPDRLAAREPAAPHARTCC